MRKDINFLESQKQVAGKKSADSVVVLTVVLTLIVIIVGAVFAVMQTQAKDLDAEIKGLEAELKNPKYSKQAQEFLNAENKLNTYLQDIIIKNAINEKIDNLDTLKSDIFDAIFKDSTEFMLYNEKQSVKVSHFDFKTSDNTQGATITLSNCSTVYNPNITNITPRDLAYAILDKFESELKNITIGEDNFKLVNSCVITSKEDNVDEDGKAILTFNVQIMLNDANEVENENK